MVEPARMSRRRHLTGFVVSGVAAFLTDAAVLEGLLVLTPLSPLVARLLSIFLAMIVSWQMHRRLTFGRQGIGTPREFLRFASTGWTAAALNYGVFAGLVLAIPSLPPLAGLVISSGVAMVFTYVALRFFVFGAEPQDRARDGAREED